MIPEDNELKKVFARRLAFLREEAGLSREELAEKLGCSNGLITHYEQGKKLPNMRIIKKLKNVFGVSADYIIGDDNL